ncbi:hypothetical protein L596_011033 [Steinernema carpocapsae]|uniref:Uncharacterized protein n=1 Tax=Steinernema carpocapsae TaxID=34508 RepID=A0A4U5NTE9_STECR|nr:hypothetical protein L596_011033 [Steinernema carpocapsae]
MFSYEIRDFKHRKWRIWELEDTDESKQQHTFDGRTSILRTTSESATYVHVWKTTLSSESKGLFNRIPAEQHLNQQMKRVSYVSEA